MVEAEGRTLVRPHPIERNPPMATIAFGNQLQPATLRSNSIGRDRRSVRDIQSHRHAVRTAAHTREVQRVYRRRRMGVTITAATIALVAVLSVFSLFGTSAAADSSSGRSPAPKYVVAQPGDTLWAIGERIAPNASITEVVDELVRLNGTSITSGQLVRIP